MSTLAESDSTSNHPINNLAILTKAIDQHSGDARRRGGGRQVAGDLDGGGGGQRGKQSLARPMLLSVVEFAANLNPAAASIVVGRSFRPLCRIVSVSTAHVSTSPLPTDLS